MTTRLGLLFYCRSGLSLLLLLRFLVWECFALSNIPVRSRFRGAKSTSLSLSFSNTKDNNNSNNDSISSIDTNNDNNPWASSEWKVTLNLGREPGSIMPEEWGASGGRLALPLRVTLTSNRPYSNKKDEQQQQVLDPMLLRNTFSLQPQSEAVKYITNEGEQTCHFSKEGGWKIRSRLGKPQGHAAKLMCYMDLQSSVQRNDVMLVKGERLYLTGKCWREEELDRALQNMVPIFKVYQQAQVRLLQALEHSSGDRRLDGTNPMDTLMGMKDTAQLVFARDEALGRYEDAKRVYPTSSSDSKLTVDNLDLSEGPWPGQVEWLSIEPQLVLVRRPKLLGEEYHIVGTWSATPCFSSSGDGQLVEEEPSIF
jgi:hypothetical protein